MPDDEARIDEILKSHRFEADADFKEKLHQHLQTKLRGSTDAYAPFSGNHRAEQQLPGYHLQPERKTAGVFSTALSSILTSVLISVLLGIFAWLIIAELLPTQEASAPPTTEPPSEPTSLALMSLVTAGEYTDPEGDSEPSFIDVVGFEIRVYEELETIEVRLDLRDIPETAPRGRYMNVVEYLWLVNIYLDGATADPAAPDYAMQALVITVTPDLGLDPTGPVEGDPTWVSFDELLERGFSILKYTRPSSRIIEQSTVVLDISSNTISMWGHIPGVDAETAFGFNTQAYSQGSDVLDMTIEDSPQQ